MTKPRKMSDLPGWGDWQKGIDKGIDYVLDNPISDFLNTEIDVAGMFSKSTEEGRQREGAKAKAQISNWLQDFLNKMND